MQLTINDNIYLRTLTPHDADALFKITDESRLFLREWLPWLDGIETVDHSRHFIEWTNALEADNRALIFGIFFEDHLVGTAGFNTIDSRNSIGKIGYWLSQKMNGQGIMHQSVKGIVDYGFSKLKLNRIEICCATENVKSRHIPESLGFKYEGEIRDGEWLYDHYVNHYIYGMLKNEWPIRA